MRIATQTMHNLSRSLKVEVDGAIRKPTYYFLLVKNSKYMLICNILRYIATQNIHDLDFILAKKEKKIIRQSAIY